jgi:hypothetical protein
MNFHIGKTCSFHGNEGSSCGLLGCAHLAYNEVMHYNTNAMEDLAASIFSVKMEPASENGGMAVQLMTLFTVPMMADRLTTGHKMVKCLVKLTKVPPHIYRDVQSTEFYRI